MTPAGPRGPGLARHRKIIQDPSPTVPAICAGLGLSGSRTGPLEGFAHLRTSLEDRWPVSGALIAARSPRNRRPGQEKADAAPSVPASTIGAVTPHAAQPRSAATTRRGARSARWCSTVMVGSATGASVPRSPLIMSCHSPKVARGSTRTTSSPVAAPAMRAVVGRPGGVGGRYERVSPAPAGTP
jgi:hypothetical protein